MAKRYRAWALTMATWARRIWASPLYLLILLQGTYIVFGITLLQFHLTFVDVAAALISALCVEYLLSRKISASTFAAALGIGIFFRAANPWYFVLAAAITIASKYIFRFRGSHIFNPSNFGILATVVALPYATTIEFTQWGADPWVFALIALASLYVSYRAGMIAISASFLFAYGALFLALSASSYTLLFTGHHFGLIGPSFILFASFMITDPRTAPRGFAAGTLHGITVALLYFVLEGLGVRYSLFIASFGTTLLTFSSRLLIEQLGNRYAIASRAPRNLLSFAVVAALFCVLVAPLLLDRRARSDITVPFILLGISSELAARCAAEPAFAAQKDTGATMVAQTNGVAWGDYDDDGHDDLFVSSAGVPSRLLHNNADNTFSDMTVAMGIPKEEGSSAYFVDFDNDGTLDLFVVTEQGPVRLYQNRSGRFSDITAKAGLSGLAAGEGTMTFADFNNDKYLDFAIANPGDNLLLTPTRYLGLQKSVLDPLFPRRVSYTCKPEEYPDLVDQISRLAEAEGVKDEVRSYMETENTCVELSYQLSMFSGLQSLTQGPITNVRVFKQGKVRLFENRAGVFAERPEFWDTFARTHERGQRSTGAADEHPFDKVSYIFWQTVAYDYDHDRLPDLFIASDNGSNILLKNKGSFAFEDVTARMGANYAGTGMGVAVADYNRDGKTDVFVDNVWKDYLYENAGDTFINHKDIPIAQWGVGWGASFIDYDLDGWEDLAIANGDTSKTPGSLEGSLSQPFFRMDNLYKNNKGTWYDATGLLCPDLQSGKALAVADYSNDGYPDLFVGNWSSSDYGSALGGAGDTLYRNTGTGAHYLKIKLIGTASNRMGIGARVTVVTEDGPQTKTAVLGESFHSQNSPVLLFGLGRSTSAEIEVRWPSGRITRTNATADQALSVRE